MLGALRTTTAFATLVSAVACSASSTHRQVQPTRDSGTDGAGFGDSAANGAGGRGGSPGGAPSAGRGGGGVPVASGGRDASTTDGPVSGGGTEAGARDARAEASRLDATTRADASDASRACDSAACSPYVCGDGGCTTTCTLGGTDCAADAVCYNIGGDGPPNYVCLKNQGADCTSPTQCGSSYCTDGKCCDTACASFCDPATNVLYQSATCASGTCAGAGTSAPCPNNLPCLGNETCMTSCYTVWVGGFPASGFPTGLNFGDCTPSAPYCNCIPSVAGGNCSGTKCCATFPCN